MSTQRPCDDPGVSRALRRATPILGNDDLAGYVGRDRDGARGPRPKSFRRTIQGLKDRSMALGRSRSLSAHKTSLDDADADSLASLRARGLSRSLTDVSVIPPMLASVPTPTPPRLKRVSAQPRPQRGPVLSVVSEGKPLDHVSPHAPHQESPSPVLSDVKTLRKLHGGTFLTKVSAKKHKVCLFRLEPDLGQIVWVSKKHKISESRPLSRYPQRS
jgi:phosphatidylinositol phospholipase C delta